MLINKEIISITHEKSIDMAGVGGMVGGCLFLRANRLIKFPLYIYPFMDEFIL